MDNLIILSGNKISGAEIVLKDYLKLTTKKFYMITSSEIERSKIFDLDNVKIIVYNKMENIGASQSFLKKINKIYNLLVVTYKLSKFIKNNSIKKVFTNNTGDILYLTLLKKNSSLKIYSFIHDMLEKEQLISKIIINNSKKIDKIMVPSLACKKATINIGLDESKIQVISTGICYKSYIEKNKFTKKIIFIGGILDRKNPLEYLEFIKEIRLKDPEYKGIIVYNNFEDAILEEVIRKNKIDELKIDFYRNLSSEQINNIFKEVDYLFICSKKDPLPTVVLEAFNNSIPVIGKNIDGIPEMLTKEKNGILYNSKEEFGDIIRNIQNIDMLKYRKLSLNANESINKNFNMEIKIKKMDELFK